MSKISEKEKKEFKRLRVKKEAWKYLKNKSTEKDTSIMEEVDTLIQNDREVNNSE